ncbi:MAG: ABC transporter ATP-binding protein [Clostridia bacterium]|nr:ABC transporter ATP-binding protein [Clostridia bacterium]
MAFISIKQVSYTYNGRKKPAVKDVSLDIERGEKVAITGLNGSGKSTLAKLMLGLLKPQKGTVLLDGKPVQKYSLPEVGEKIGYLLQNPSQMLFNTTVYNEVAFGLKWRGKSRAEIHRICKGYLEHFDLWQLRDAFPFNLSEGQKQLVALTAILALQPACLVLDEPTKSIDVSRKKKLIEILEDIWRQGTGIIVISHDVGFITRFGGRRVHLVEGEVVDAAAGC